VTKADLGEFDHIYAMDRMNHAALLRLAGNPQQAEKISLIMEAGGLGPKEVPDPYHGDHRDFEKVYEILEKACGAIAKKLN